MDLSALLLTAILYGPDPQPGLPSHPHALHNHHVAVTLEKETHDRSYRLWHRGEDAMSWAVWSHFEDQRGRAALLLVVVQATDPARPWLCRRVSYQELVDRLGARAVLTGQFVCPWGEWVPIK